ncbi:exodeoxyribonuclease VII large subunit [Algoriphagus sediminis]|uniref:Exodeoxyribonuclease 7 large subunit n=1 Tax=Algoriphagus sediminis TaxID=3057113 RepID=A0ABT7Y8F4_9BACT|nr:exodeoxyribonuclease VII large subunit [Algoriphagus sediminis]MDN3202788.1 exodeoxyribonuclease VII large subunit [Algoriphagus sediminis]
MQQAITVSQLNLKIKSTLEGNLEPTYWVVGELTDFRVAGQGHAYFELVEKSGNSILAKIRSNIWAFSYREISYRFEQTTGSELKTGMKVLAKVAVIFHPIYGLSANVKDIDASFSLGERARIKQETIDRLTKEGLINLNSSIPLSQVLQKVAIVSSSTAAGYQDFVRQLETNNSGYKIYHKLFQATLQGTNAAKSIIDALDAAEMANENLGFDAVVLIRGGGAQLDLDCFDEYVLAKRIATMRLPVLTGIGHERDETIADLVSHTPLKTPTAVAEFVLSSFREFDENLRLAFIQIERLTRSHFQLENSQLEARLRSIQHQSKVILQNSLQKIDSIQNRIELISRNSLNLRALELTQIEKSLMNLDPISVMKRGFSRTEKDGIPIDKLDLKQGDSIKTYTLSKTIESEIKKVENHE